MSYVQNWTVEGTHLILWGPRGEKNGDLNTMNFKATGPSAIIKFALMFYKDGEYLSTGLAILDL